MEGHSVWEKYLWVEEDVDWNGWVERRSVFKHGGRGKLYVGERIIWGER